jgi:hypothetical protein
VKNHASSSIRREKNHIMRAPALRARFVVLGARSWAILAGLEQD